jgi:hypothetical protein
MTPPSDSTPRKTHHDVPEAPTPTSPEPAIETEKRENRWRERVKVVVEVLTLAAVIFYGGVAYRQWTAMVTANKQTKTAFILLNALT